MFCSGPVTSAASRRMSQSPRPAAMLASSPQFPIKGCAETRVVATPIEAPPRREIRPA
jgi:hypothetical protein